MMRWIRLGLPLVILILLAVFLGRGLQLNPRLLPSTQVDKLAPPFTLPMLNNNALFSPSHLKGKVWILNVFASWCAACVVEHPRLVQLASEQKLPIIGLAYKDDPANTQLWLQRYGNPYTQVVFDIAGKTGIDYGVYGVPETFVIDANGFIRYRHVGPVDDDFFDQHLRPLLTAKS